MGTVKKDPALHWPREIPFGIHSSYPAGDIPSKIHAALLVWEKATLYRFYPATGGEAAWIEFRREESG